MGILDALRRQPTRFEDLTYDQIVSFAASGDDPRKVSSGTSLQAKGTVDPPQGSDLEQGSSRGSGRRETVPALRSRSAAINTYGLMTDNDAATDVSLRAGKAPVQGANYYMQPFDEKPINQDISEFVSFNILEGPGKPFLLVMEDILRMYEDGSSVFETVWEEREWAPRRTGANRRKYTMLHKLGYRPATTIKEFVYDDNGGPIGIKHNALRADNKVEEEEIEIDKLLIFVFNQKGGNLEGKSLLRTAYKHWYYKDNLYQIDGIQKERHGTGFPVVTLPPNFTGEDKNVAHELVSNIRTNERGGAVLPPGFELAFAKIEGQPVDVLKSIEHHNGMIMLNVMVQFLLLGLMEGGGRATSGSQQDMFNKSLRYVANVICQSINMYLIPRLVGYNFDTTEFPRMQVRNIGETKDLQQWASALSNLAAQNLITLDLETEQWVRNIVDMPDKLGGKQTPEANASKGGGGFGKGNVSGTGEGDRPGAPTDSAST